MRKLLLCSFLIYIFLIFHVSNLSSQEQKTIPFVGDTVGLSSFQPEICNFFVLERKLSNSRTGELEPGVVKYAARLLVQRVIDVSDYGAQNFIKSIPHQKNEELFKKLRMMYYEYSHSYGVFDKHIKEFDKSIIDTYIKIVDETRNN